MEAHKKEKWLKNLFDELEKPLMMYAFRIVKNKSDAQDLVQDSFIKLNSQTCEILCPKAWLYKTLRNLSISHLRKNGRIKLTSDEEQLNFFDQMGKTSNNSPSSRLEKKEVMERILHSVELLPSQSRKILELKFNKQSNYQEIADSTGLSSTNVGYKLHHIIKNIATDLTEEGFFK